MQTGNLPGKKIDNSYPRPVSLRKEDRPPTQAEKVVEVVPHPNGAHGVSQEGFLTKVMPRIRYLDCASWRQIPMGREFSHFVGKLAGGTALGHRREISGCARLPLLPAASYGAPASRGGWLPWKQFPEKQRYATWRRPPAAAWGRFHAH